MAVIMAASAAFASAGHKHEFDTKQKSSSKNMNEERNIEKEPQGNETPPSCATGGTNASKPPSGACPYTNGNCCGGGKSICVSVWLIVLLLLAGTIIYRAIVGGGCGAFCSP